MTERLHFHFSLSCIGEGNGTPLQCSCLENPRDGEAWWAAIYGVAQSQTRLKRLSSSRPGAELMGEISCFYFRILIFFHAHDLTHLCGQTKFRTQALKVDSYLLESLVNNMGSNTSACLSPSFLPLCGSLSQEEEWTI